MTRIASTTFLAALSLVAACSREPTATWDLVVANGRVMDPESGLDAVRHVGISAGRIEAISERPLQGTRVIDAAGHVVAPGFVDMHEHGQQEEAYALMVRDGVTTALELEVGTGDVAAWYAARASGQIVNYGVSVGHLKARMKVLGDPAPVSSPGDRWAAPRRRRRSRRWSPSSARSRRRRRGRRLRKRLRAWGDDVRKLSGCSASRRRDARRRTSTCATAQPGWIPPSPRPRRPGPNSTSSM